MSGIIHKVKDTIAQHKENKAEQKAEKTDEHHTGNDSTNYGPHDSNIANEADPRVDSDRSKMTGSSGNHGPHDSKLANKTDPRVDSDRDGRAAYTSTAAPTTTGAAYGSTDNYDTSRSSNFGPHDSKLANKADPRVDSDLDGRAAYTSNAAPTATGAAYGSTNNYDSSRSSNYGPHDSNVGNAVDPRVDSDLDSRGARNASTGYSAAGPTSAGTGYGSTGTNYGTANTYDSSRSSNYGPHDSKIANEVDPRVDSDRDGRAAHHSTSSGHGAGYAATGAAVGAGAGYVGSQHHSSTHSPSTGPATSTAGPHSSNLENKMDPRIDSDTPNDRYSASTGPASKTAGPHESNIANEADPRVDSDRSKADFVGGNSSFNNDVHKGSLGGGNMIPISGHKPGASTTTQTFEKAQNENLGGSSVAGSSYTGQHTGQRTAGPHSSDVANKLDPRVDSDLDGSKTLGSQRV
ncbi:hypothetical protein N7520_008389 [Penicillium odoratum]|uniref:uncharacterized protein n=1 Tax=Penicillium odoratum TaxID=1167516 RepID=UPI002548A33C|nr:uncharacterized protein N7520_008389 [Penicillium odoratum]KAJ5761233.1 hypothetical protein N7520_008389 [Penicillium odoratum]